MTLLIGISLVCGFFTFFFLFRTINCARRLRLIRAGGAGAGCLVSAALAGVGIMLLVSYWSYGQLTGETVGFTDRIPPHLSGGIPGATHDQWRGGSVLQTPR